MRKPYYKKSRECWYFTDSRTRREIRLHPDEDVARQLWENWIFRVHRIRSEFIPPNGLRIDLPVYQMPAIPSSFVGFTPETKEDMPLRPGVYVIVDANHKCKYVGQAKNLRRRLTAQQHSNIDRSSDLVSWVELHKDELLLAESYLIGMLRPYANFSGNRTLQRKASMERRAGAQLANCVGESA